MIKTVTILLMTMLVAACMGRPEELLNSRPVTLPESAPETSVYARLLAPRISPLFSQRVTANFSSDTATLHHAIVSALPFSATVVAEDDTVELYQPISVRASNLSVGDYLRQLEGLTGYRIDLNADTAVVRVAGLVSKTWHLAALSGMARFNASIGLDGDDGESAETASRSRSDRSHRMRTEMMHDDDVWASIVSQAECILGIRACIDDDDESNPLPLSNQTRVNAPAIENRSWLVASHRLGTITAVAPPFSIARLDEWLRGLSDESLRLVRLDCAILDLAFDSENASGIDLEAVFSDGKFSLGHYAGSPRGASAPTGWTIGSFIDSRRFDLDLFIRYLERESKVKVRSRASLSVTNGATAYLNTGEEFSYVSNVDTVATQGVATTSFNQSRVQTGLQLAITPRLVGKDGKILVEVMPVLSSLIRFDELGSGSNQIKAPVIALRQLSSQAISGNGRPIVIGAMNWDKWSAGKVNLARDSVHESRQLLIVITPREIAA